MAMTEKETEAKQALIDVLHKNEAKIGRDSEHVLRYKCDDVLVVLEPEGEKLKVKACVEEAPATE